jgi:tRNA threonylcarbamoyladenosine biosynthesis protein TsaE
MTMARPFPLVDLILSDERATEVLAQRVAKGLLPGDILLLEGPVGAGKSTLARAVIRARLGEPTLEVPSPTYTLVQTYAGNGVEIWHADLYRLEDPADILELGLTDAFGKEICLVEWPDRLGADVPESAVTLSLASHADGSHGLTARGDKEILLRLGLVDD